MVTNFERSAMRMTRHRIFAALNSSGSPGSCLIAVALTLSFCTGNASAQMTHAYALQNCMQTENRARSSNTVREWCSAGQAWLSQAAYVSRVPSTQDWVKEKQDPSMKGLSIAVHKRAIACFLKAYELEGAHPNPHSRGHSEAVKNLTNAYKSLIRVDPRNGDWHYLLGEILCAQGWYIVATSELKRAEALGGAAASKATALETHVRPFMKMEIAIENSLTKENNRIAEENAKLEPVMDNEDPRSPFSSYSIQHNIHNQAFIDSQKR